VEPELDFLKQEKASLEIELTNIKMQESVKLRLVTTEEFFAVYKNLEQDFEMQNPEQKRKLLRAFVRRLEFDPINDSLKIFLFAEPTATVWYSNGAQDRT
jgi:hypothetical protein